MGLLLLLFHPLAKPTLTLNAQLPSSRRSDRTPKLEVYFNVAGPSTLQSSISQESTVALAHARAEHSTLAMSHRPTEPWGLDYTRAFSTHEHWNWCILCSLVQQSLITTETVLNSRYL